MPPLIPSSSSRTVVAIEANPAILVNLLKSAIEDVLRSNGFVDIIPVECIVYILNCKCTVSYSE